MLSAHRSDQYKPDIFGQYGALHAVAGKWDVLNKRSDQGRELMGRISGVQSQNYDRKHNLNILSACVTAAAITPYQNRLLQYCIAYDTMHKLSDPTHAIYVFLDNTDFTHFHQQSNADAKALNSANLYTPNKRMETETIDDLLAVRADANFIKTPTYEVCKIFQDNSGGKTQKQKAMFAREYLDKYGVS